jgi:chromosome segregation ATPase
VRKRAREEEFVEEQEHAAVETQQEAVPVAEPMAEASGHDEARRDFEGELTQSQQRIDSLTNEIEMLRQTGKLSEESLQRLSVTLAEEVKRRSQIQSEYDAYRAKTDAELEQVSLATRTLAEEKQTLEQRAAQAEAKATKLEVIVSEFPDLLGYAELIPASVDPEVVRGACRKLQEARQRDLETVRSQAVSNRFFQMSSSPARTEPAVADPEALGRYLREAMDDPVEFQRREAIVQQQLQSIARRI